jgi:hypothetical protein
MCALKFVILNSDGVPEVCDFEQWERWFFEGGGKRSDANQTRPGK